MRNYKNVSKNFLRYIYLRLPVSDSRRIKMKNLFFKSFRIVLRNTKTYHIWLNSFSFGDQQVLSNEVQALEFTSMDKRDRYLQNLFFWSNNKSPEYVPYSNESINREDTIVKLIAFYLPQFHPIPENDQWWGKGFTEWTNVTKAVPQFVGHYQPRLPDELGFYDLRFINVMKRQAELARQYGVYGFCFYHYWFSGKRLLERPVDQLLEHPEIDLPFCLCWANENWSRRWDGEEHDILMEQKYSDEDDNNFIKDLSRYLKDKRYIKINEKPVVLVYRPGLFPNFKKTAGRWREFCRMEGIGEIHLLGVSWGITNPDDFGLDGLVEFPPHSMHEYGCEMINDKVDIVNPDFKGLIFDYKKYVEHENYLFDTDYKLYKGVAPSWDNTARKSNNGTIYHGASPSLYKNWLKSVIRHTNSTFNDDKVVFINAWNEWAEGAYLEPDRKYGYAYLQSTKEALEETSKEIERNLIYVSHNAHFNGAQLLALNMIDVFSQQFGYSVEIILEEGGVLLEEYRKLGNVTLLSDGGDSKELAVFLAKLYKKNYRIAITNTVIAGIVVPHLAKCGFKILSLIHELPGVIGQYKAEERARNISEYSNTVVFPSRYVLDKYVSLFPIDHKKQVVLPQGLYKANKYKGQEWKARTELRKTLGFSPETPIIVGVGYADRRKGIDLFCEVAFLLRRIMSDVRFVWIGSRDPYMIDEIQDDRKKSVIFIDPTHEVDLYYAGADLYLLTSREDPFPSVVLESLNVGVPVVGFRDAGGFSDIVNDTTGRLVEYSNSELMVSAIIELLESAELRRVQGKNGCQLIENKYYFRNYLYQLLDMAGHSYKKVSVIVPNYNYAKYLPKRLETIISQTYPIYELIILDDCSTDESRNIIETYPFDSRLRIKKIFNDKNSGSVFRQWAKGISNAEGEIIWIAEADDLSSPHFLEEVIAGFNRDPEVVIGYAQSYQMDESGQILCDNYLDYTSDIDSKKWKSSYIEDGITEIAKGMSVKNTIPNVSGAIFKKPDINEILQELTQFKIAGDWFFYIKMLQKGKIYFNHKSLNYHRRHTNSVTKSEKNTLHYEEIVHIQDRIQKIIDVDSAVQKKVINYREYVKDYLGIK
ncbi:glycosyltransferase [Cohnella sp. CFH 77786]|uniref:glycoside hydrolase family 99-like domain-containing protein n=1 Tax=Cohnella sp. CFH 77786 TaxID=2662265 RepID=UPI001C60AC0F|nr:glycoside hydrolase family 99-like domain-containing protein [Cohnella sp. CFH 77786]MBW5448501.1 glycosyltransferase [Cohnella sp. CFH 77786]